MNLPSLTLSAFLLILPSLLTAQPREANTEIGDAIELSGSTQLLDYIGTIDDMHYLLLNNKGSISIMQLNDKLEFVKEKSVYDHKETDPHVYLKGMIYNGQIIVFTKAVSPKQKTTNLCIHVIDRETLDPEIKPRTVARLKLKASYNPGITGNLYYNLPNREEFGLRLSPDGKKILAFTFIDTKTTDGEGIWTKIFGEKLDSIYEGTINLPLKNDLFQLEDVRIDNDGNIFTLGTDFPKKKYHKKTGLPDYAYHVTIFRGKTKTPTDITIKLRGKSVGDMNMGMVAEGKLACYGTWVNSGYFQARGFFVLIYDVNTGAEISQYESDDLTDFFPEFLDRKINKIDRTYMHNNGAGYYLYQFREPIVKPDGSFFITAEQFAVKYRDNDAFISGVDLYEIQKVSSLVYDEIFVFSISAEGKPQFKVRIPKLQGGTFVASTGYSYQSIFDGENLYLYYNNVLKNIEEDKSGRFDKLSGAVLVAAQINQKGVLDISEIHNYEGSNVCYEPRMALAVNNGQIIIPGVGKGLMGKMFKGKSEVQILRSTVKE